MSIIVIAGLLQSAVNTQHAFSIIQDRIKAKEREIQQVLQAAMEKYKRELRANMECHEHLAAMAEESRDQNLALLHRVLADTYRSLFGRARFYILKIKSFADSIHHDAGQNREGQD